MPSIVCALEHGRVLKRSENSKPNRADVESAFRTIIRWTGDDPERDGLVDTPDCISTRGVHQPGTDLVTSRTPGCFRDNSPTRQEFLTMVD
jgi:GTP cyclohydrolase IA